MSLSPSLSVSLCFHKRLHHAARCSLLSACCSLPLLQGAVCDLPAAGKAEEKGCTGGACSLCVSAAVLSVRKSLANVHKLKVFLKPRIKLGTSNRARGPGTRCTTARVHASRGWRGALPSLTEGALRAAWWPSCVSACAAHPLVIRMLPMAIAARLRSRCRGAAHT